MDRPGPVPENLRTWLPQTLDLIDDPKPITADPDGLRPTFDVRVGSIVQRGPIARDPTIDALESALHLHHGRLAPSQWVVSRHGVSAVWAAVAFLGEQRGRFRKLRFLSRAELDVDAVAEVFRSLSSAVESNR